ncbi:MAG: outer membrane beta-barrel protein, partial [Prevotella sp.]|nr:outer membrane beta-barrel protein [Prevotella sp.]
EHSQRYVIDVRLKKEYMIGWIANVEGGAGTDDRYLARLFAMRHSDFSNLAVIANANNLDDDSRPDESNSWQRGQTNDLRRTERADLHFNVSDRNRRWEFAGEASVNHQTTEGESRTVRQNFLPTGDTYDHSFSSRENEDLRFSTWQSFYRNHKNVRWHIDPSLNYHHFDHSSGMTSATFNAPVANVSRQLLNDLYSPASTRISLRDTLVNRILQEGAGKGHELKGTFNTGATIKIPHSNENLRLGATITLTDRDEHLFTRQSVQYAAVSQQPTTSLHHFTDNHPDRSGSINATVGYNIPLGKGWRSLFTTYEYTHDWRHRRSTLYLLDRLDRQPETIDQLPSVSEYQQVMDSRNSFDSRSTEDRHKLDVNLGYAFDEKSYGKIWTLLNGNVSVRSQHLDYQRGRIDTTLCRTAFTISMADWTYLDLKGGQQIGLTLGVQTDLPDLEQRIDLRDDTDPMNIRLGNPNLRTAVTPEFKINGVYRKKLSYHYLEWGYQRTYNAIAMGYVYDPQTGVRTYRPENVDGNWTTDGGYTFHCSLDSTKKLNLDIPFHITYAQSVDLVGVAPLSSPEGDTNVLKSNEAPSGAVGGATSTVRRLALSLTPTFKADIGRHHLELTCQPTWERLTGTRPDFQDFHAFTCRTSLSAILKLPWKLDLSTDLGLYTRTGYADENLNTSDLVWNARLSRPFFKGNLLVVVDGFDLLGQLSNVTRTLNAQGRTETYTNVMPRYALFHIIYRLNKQPKNNVSKQ